MRLLFFNTGMNNQLRISILITLILAGCQNKIGDNGLTPVILIDSIEIWHNLMPGGEPTLHFTSVIRIAKKDAPINADTVLKKLQLLKNDSLVAIFKINSTDISASYPDSVKNTFQIFRLSSQEGISGFKSTVYEGYITRIYFKFDEKEFFVQKTGIQIEKVY